MAGQYTLQSNGWVLQNCIALQVLAGTKCSSGIIQRIGQVFHFPLEVNRFMCSAPCAPQKSLRVQNALHSAACLKAVQGGGFKNIDAAKCTASPCSALICASRKREIGNEIESDWIPRLDFTLISNIDKMNDNINVSYYEQQ